MGINLSYIEGQTPIDEDEKSGLKIKTITTRNELDEWEQLNIEDAINRYKSNSRRKQYKQTQKGRYYTTYRHYKKRIMDCKSKR